MGQFSYEALDKSGRQVKGIIDAANEDIIIEKLRGMGYYPLKVVPHRIKASELDIFAMPGLRQVMHRIRRKHVVTFTRQLATLIDAGLPILRSLHILEEQVESVLFKQRIGQMAKDIESGSSLSEAMAKHPKVFDKLYVNMVRAGEIGGVLEAILNKIAEFLEKRQAMIGKVRSAMMYPLVVGCVALLIVTFILWKIVPRFADIFASLGAPLPKLTLALVTASDIVANKTLWVVAGIVVLVFTFRWIYRTREGKYVIDAGILKLPVFGVIFRKVAIVRFAGTLATLITAGVPILQALD
ncbi:MAG: type II secretion system F family protein, partial [Candidatus Sumerlaeota bacterium]|nr:type II secretion system F family protein [Candidatus Sumerlaeota bacterium]